MNWMCVYWLGLVLTLGLMIGWSNAPGAFPSGGYQNVRDGDSAEFA
jgi:hypothetical protein